jgi:undecaprenyl-diphosphatase
MDYLNSLLPTIEHFQALGYWIVFLVSVLESLAFVGLFVPGTFFLVAVGALCSKGILDVGDVIWFSALGAIAGDGISFYLGRRGKRFTQRWDRLIKSSYMEKGERFLDAHGNKSVFLGRFIGPIRSVIPFVAGFFKMPPQRFFFWNILSAPCWATAYVFIGYFFGQAWEFTKLWTTRGGILLISLCILLFILYLLRWEILKRGREFFAFMRSIWESIIQAVLMNPNVQMLVRHHPIFFRFMQGRLDKKRFFGLPLTLFTIAFLYALFLFLGVVEDIVTSDPIMGIDIRVANLLSVFRDSGLTTIFIWITLLGKWEVVAVLAMVATVVLALFRKWIYIFPLWFALLGSQAFDFLGKIAFHRQRPDVALYLEKSFSFPSGHATVAVAFYGFILYIFWRNLESFNKRLNLFFLCLLIALAIGFSRLYLGVHFLSDVWGGYLLGFLWLIIGVSVVEWLTSGQRVKAVSEYRPSPTVKAVAWALVSAWALFFLGFGLHYVPPQPYLNRQVREIVSDDVLGVFERERLPRYTETLSGENQEPLSFVVAAHSEQQLIDAFRSADWYPADAVALATLARTAKAAFLNENYPTAPMTPSFWNNRVHDLGFERPTSLHSVRERHHARFWRTDILTQEGKIVYVGTASLDFGIKWGITHKIRPDIDTEREYLLLALNNTGLVERSRRIQFVAPVMGRNFSGDPFFTDGSLYLLRLK